MRWRIEVPELKHEQGQQVLKEDEDVEAPGSFEYFSDAENA